jgi:hypothetical protein
MTSVPALADTAVQLAGEGDGEGAVRALISQAGDRSCLEEVRDVLVRRLHRRSDDFAASGGLKLVVHALQHLPYTNGFERIVGYCPTWGPECEGAR